MVDNHLPGVRLSLHVVQEAIEQCPEQVWCRITPLSLQLFLQVIRSAQANAVNNHGLDGSRLKVGMLPYLCSISL